jgi:hypothetical protein
MRLDAGPLPVVQPKQTCAHSLNSTNSRQSRESQPND